MSDLDIRDTREPASRGEESPARWPFWLWVATSLAWLGYLAFGSIEIRLWRFGRLNFEDRRITTVWAHFGDNLPDLPGNGLFTALLWVSVAVMVAATIWGLRLILLSPEPRPTPHHATPQASDADDA